MTYRTVRYRDKTTTGYCVVRCRDDGTPDRRVSQAFARRDEADTLAESLERLTSEALRARLEGAG